MDGLLAVVELVMVIVAHQDMVPVVLVVEAMAVLLIHLLLLASMETQIQEVVEVDLQDHRPTKQEVVADQESLWSVIHHKQRINKVPYEFI
tara:strand:+ start:287 stop:559 length:273 start_codon:yes stop_codon:yes gene_type:complete